MLLKRTTPQSIDVSFKRSVEHQLQVTPRTKCTPLLFSDSKSKERQISDTVVIVFHKAHGTYQCSTTSADSSTLTKPEVNEKNLYLNIIYDRKNYITNYNICIISHHQA